MKPRKSGFWSIVLVGVMMFSGRLPFSAFYSAAQPLPPDSIQGQRPLSEILEWHHKLLDEQLSKINQALEESARAHGRELLESERVKIVREVVLKPHPTSPVKDVTLIYYELSDGSTGEYSASPIFQPWVTQPFGYITEATNIDEGWYIVRYATPEENQQMRKKPEEAEPVPEAQGEPRSFLNRVIDLLSPSEALACPPCLNTYTHSACKTGHQTEVEVARDGVKMTWKGDNGCGPVIVSTNKLCQPTPPWQYLAPCDAPTAYPVFDMVVARHTDSYESPGYPNSGARLVITSYVYGQKTGAWVSDGSCMKSGPDQQFFNCAFSPINDCF